MIWLVIISVLVLGEVLELLSGGWTILRQCYCWGIFCPLSCRCYHLSFLEPKVIARYLQREWLRAKADTTWRRDNRIFSCFYFTHMPKERVDAFQQKQFHHLL
jgi:hypothetical protein